MSEGRRSRSVLRDKAARVRADERVFKPRRSRSYGSVFVPDDLVEAADAADD